MSRRSPRNWDGSPAGRPDGVCVVVCTDDGQHGERVVGRLTWKRDDVNPADPRWSPEGMVLRGARGEIVEASGDHGGSVRLHCNTCHRDLQWTWSSGWCAGQFV